jgi:hypothetical protein
MGRRERPALIRKSGNLAPGRPSPPLALPGGPARYTPAEVI